MNWTTSPYLPGQGPKPDLPSARSPVTEETSKTNEVFVLGLEAYERGFYWESHELLESLWHLQTGSEKILLQILIQRAAAKLKIKMKDDTAARTILTSAQNKVDEISAADRTLLGVDLLELKNQLEGILKGI